MNRRQVLGLGMAGLALARSAHGAHPGAAAEEPSVIVLDDTDPNFRGDGPHADGVRAFSGRAKELWSVRTLNNCRAIGVNHGVALDLRRGRIFTREFVSDRVTSLDLGGKVRFQVKVPDVSALAVDPETGNLWCTGTPGTTVLDGDGRRVASHDVGGFDIDYDLATGSFWVVGRGPLARVDRGGKPALKGGPAPGWAYASVSADPLGEGAWVVEREHFQVAGSVDRLLFVTADGRVMKRIQRPGWRPFGVACDTKGHAVWVSALGSDLTRISLEDDSVRDVPIRAIAVAVGPSSDQLWATTSTELLRLDPAGKVIARAALGGPSSQSWLAAF
jgi:hypothetical protein